MAAYAFFCNISIFCVGFKPISGISFKIRTLFAILGVAFILMHDRHIPSVIPCSVHLDARMIPPRYGIKCGDFLTCFFVQQVARYRSVIPYCSVHQDARMISLMSVFYSCNKLHATGDSLVFTTLKRCMLIIVSYDELC